MILSPNELRAVLAGGSVSVNSMDNERTWSQRVPASKDERQRILARVEELSQDDSPPISRQRLETLARSVLDSDEYLAWTMVLVGNRFERNRVRRIPFNRRILLLPHCMRNTERCPAEYGPEELDCRSCGMCELAGLKNQAQTLGYHVMIAEGSPIVMQWILSGKADAILGVGCLRSLERAYEKLQFAGIPAMAVPLHGSQCRDSETDVDWVREMIQMPYEKEGAETGRAGGAGPTWIHLLRGASKLFDEDAFRRVSPHDPIKATERLGVEFLGLGGKFYRPFITLATFDALTGSRGTGPDGEEHVAAFPDWVRETAKAVEIFHKASLIHDDIEDGDFFRYGKPTIHSVHGPAVAINVGDYLIGLGYRLVAKQRKRIPASKQVSPGEIVAEILAKLSEAHLKLSEGQGAEMAWKELKNENLTSLDVLKIYVLKTSPAFEAAIGIGGLLAVASGEVDRSFFKSTEETLARFSRHLGVAFQIKNDLDDWLPDKMNKKTVGADVLHGRPTLLWALAGEGTLEPGSSVDEVFEHYSRNNVFEKARRLIDKYAARARETAESVAPAPFRRLLLHLVETIAGAGR